jgi:hypothetical protein
LLSRTEESFFLNQTAKQWKIVSANHTDHQMALFKMKISKWNSRKNINYQNIFYDMDRLILLCLVFGVFSFLPWICVMLLVFLISPDYIKIIYLYTVCLWTFYNSMTKWKLDSSPRSFMKIQMLHCGIKLKI